MVRSGNALGPAGPAGREERSEAPLILTRCESLGELLVLLAEARDLGLALVGEDRRVLELLDEAARIVREGTLAARGAVTAGDARGEAW